MLATLGDLLEDVVVHLSGPINRASDTHARIERRRGGSAANVAETAAVLGHRARYLGQVGSDPIGAALIEDLGGSGVDVASVRRGGRSGTIIVLVDESGERTMLTDRGACLDLCDPDPVWLDGITTLHVPFYSLTDDPLAATAVTLIGWAHQREIVVSIDLSSSALIEEITARRVIEQIEALRPDVVFANHDEAAALGLAGPLAGAVTVIKNGGEPVVAHLDREQITVPVPVIGHVTDTTGAGDAFAAGYLTSAGTNVSAAIEAGCLAAAHLITSR